MCSDNKCSCPGQNMNIEDAYGRGMNRRINRQRSGWGHNAIYPRHDALGRKGYSRDMEYKKQFWERKDQEQDDTSIHSGWALMKSQLFSSFTAGCLIVWLWLCHYLSLARSCCHSPTFPTLTTPTLSVWLLTNVCSVSSALSFWPLSQPAYLFMFIIGFLSNFSPN